MGYPVKHKTLAPTRVKSGQSERYLEANVGCPPRTRRIWVYFNEDGIGWHIRVSGEDGWLPYEATQPDSIDRFLADFKRIWDTLSIQSWTRT